MWDEIVSFYLFFYFLQMYVFFLKWAKFQYAFFEKTYPDGYHATNISIFLNQILKNIKNVFT